MYKKNLPSYLSRKGMTSVAWKNFYTCMNLMDGEETKLEFIVYNTTSMVAKLEELSSDKPSISVSSDFETYYGTLVPKEATIHPPPPPSTTKGRGKRIQTPVEAASAKKGNLRRCSGCDTVTNHDRRTCPVWNA